MSHPLLNLLCRAADGEFPDPDGTVSVVPPGRGLECSVAFTGHAVVATELAADEVLWREPDGFGGSLAPDFLRWLAGPSGRIGTVDAILVARGRRGRSILRPREDLDEHHRVQHARSLRSDVHVFGDERGFVTLANGLAGRRELSIELTNPGPSSGLGRSLLLDALALLAEDEPVFAAVSPGNARSLRSFLAVGFTPIGSEVIYHPGPR